MVVIIINMINNFHRQLILYVSVKTIVVDVMKMGNIVFRVGLEPTSLAYIGSTTLQHIACTGSWYWQPVSCV